MPAAKPGRQEVMNAGPHHAKLRVTAQVASSVYVAGSEISGKMDVECRAEKGLGLGTIMVELMAFQELNSRDHAATSTFIHTRRVFQGPGLPLSNAVLPEDEKGRFPPHHFPARRGITTFFFRFPLPLTSPASVDFGSGLAKIRYEIRASASVAWKGERRLVTDSQEVQVVESAMQEVESAGTVVGESGKIWVQGKVLGGAVIAGQTCCIELHVKNHSSRKTTGVNVALQRMLHLDNPPPQHTNLILSDTLVTGAFHSAEYCCPPGLEGIAKLVINIPRTARTVKGGSRESGEAGADKTIPALFDIRGSVNVRLCMGVGAKDLELNLPVVISHPAALAPEAQSLGPPNQDPSQMRANSPLYDPSYSPFPPSQSPVLSQPTGYSSYPLAASPTLPYTQLYFPPPSPQLPHILSQFPAPPTSPGLPMSPVLLMSPGHPMSPVLPMSPMHPMLPVLPMTPGPPISPDRSMSPVLPYPHTMSPVHAYQNQPPFQQPQVYSPPRSPVHPGTSRSPQSPRRALPQPPQRRPQAKPKGPAPNPPPLPPRPTSAEPHVHEVGVDLPPANGTPLSPSAGRIQAAAKVPDPVEGKGTRASRISEHLKMSSRTRSVSPTGRRFPGPQAQHRTPASSHPPSPRNAPIPVAEAKPLVRYALMDNPMPKVVTEWEAPRSLPSAAQSPVQSPSRPPAQLPSQPPAQPASFPIAPQSSQESHGEAPGSPSRPKPGSRPVSSQSGVPAHMASSGSHPPSPRAATSPMVESKPLVRYELSDNPVPKTPSQPGTPKSTTSAVQLPSQPSVQSTRVPVQRASMPIPPRPSQDQFSQPASTPQSRPTSRPASVVVASSPATESKPLVRYELSDNPVPKPSPRPKLPELTPAPVRIPVQAPVQQPKTQAVPWPRPAGRPQSVAAPPQSHAPGGSRHAAFTVLSSPVIETQPLGPSDLAYEPISFTPVGPETPYTTRDIPQSPVRSPPSLANTSQLPREDIGQPTASPIRPKPEPRSQPWAPTSPVIPDHVPRYQLTDGPVSKLPVRYQLEDPPISKSPTTSPALVQASGPEAILTSHRANLRPVSSTKLPPQPKARPRTPPSPIPAAAIPLPQSPTKPVIPPRAAAASRPAPPLFPRIEERAIDPVPPPSAQPTSPKRRDPSPRPRPQDPPARSAVPVEDDVFRGEQRMISNPQRAGAESQAAQRAKYFESLAAAKRNNPPEKSQPGPQNVRQILQPHQANTVQPHVGTRHAQVQIQPPPVQPQSPARMTPIRTAPPSEIPVPRPLPSPQAVHASPMLNHDLPLRSPSPIFTANPVPPTPPTARSLIPVTSSGFEVPAILPGRNARERADAALREAELFRLKREAITRVPMWLGNGYTPQAPPPRAVRSFNAMDLPPQTYWDIQQPGQEEPTMTELLSRESTPVGRATYDPQLKHPRPRPVSAKPPPALLPSDKQLMDKYNVQQSARGGRGGQVTAVTSIWENGKGDQAPALAPERKPQAKRYTAPVGMFGITAKGVSPDEGTSPGMIKSTSVPAMMHTSQAVPVLSSAASLARPIGSQSARIRMMPFASSIPESQSDDTLIRKTSQSSDIPVGQARLKELIGKYQS
ncbi:hypothetical protein FRC11_010389 [Ceratobasidium sp. 423]|nr:hypothetical protein FRC11_010389 [Ceratobasidium sp. 423]